jgi:hypothetical protein
MVIGCRTKRLSVRYARAWVALAGLVVAAHELKKGADDGRGARHGTTAMKGATPVAETSETQFPQIPNAIQLAS